MYSEEIIRRVERSLRQDGNCATKTCIKDLSKVQVMDLYLMDYGEKISPSEVRRVIMEIFGINLEGISSLEKIRISVFSKGQWITQQPRDLFVVHAGAGDVDVKIYPTDYFKEQSGIDKIPDSLGEKLVKLGYQPQKDKKEYYYRDPSAQPVPMDFKDETMSAIGGVVKRDYQDL
ncbi:hypothetical protein [Halobacillus massiliensis]|uniref:hypothetical protein n=1 Tax=Halobacillus massiliensis TaxID=1926286 RepID=UPI0009E291D0|nr:hypothetical protein [Halobacillus massiliensis]